MTSLDKKVGFIGGGNMGEAMLGALISSGTVRADQIYISDVVQERLAYLDEKYGVHVGRDNPFLFDTCDIVILAVKPQSMEKVLSGVTENDGYGVSKRKLVISIAAGVPIKKLEQLLYTKLNEASIAKLGIVRVMPNTPCLVLSGMSGFCGNENVVEEDISNTKVILSSMGKVIEFTEKDMDGVTAVSGSGPAYVFFLAESMIQAAINLGFSKEDATTLSLATIKGASELMEKMDDSPEELRRKVTSPNGTTEAAFKVLEKTGVKNHFIDAIAAAAARSKELSK